jgi:hypothetical protein
LDDENFFVIRFLYVKIQRVSCSIPEHDVYSPLGGGRLPVSRYRILIVVSWQPVPSGSSIQIGASHDIVLG